ncbi:glycosyl transferase family 2 [Phocaeicola salanitronis DSM 18170]|uniref:Glycosyl transferase family 2 n=1 Tax=Phocaeicola salanitronis (strain DSM 18170 / JCM 13657 / CCUG 60908 / BL78) TaxID=667015 RepID=F0R6X4_PHOSB|nr:glycosyltransferase [Phocaeicola salanitronis]ADY34891.1 glycosyl transferase family 2 [Phocaeicola salanitronis DSM 18170]
MKFSVTIPAYKARFLKECIESILAQTYKDFELIIVNDASPEDLTSIVKSFNDPRIRYYINETNCGAVNVVDNWNKCLEYATGEYIICMGDDDMLAENALQTYNDLICKYPNVDLFHSRTMAIDEKGFSVALMLIRNEYESLCNFMLYRFFPHNGNMQFIGDFCFRTTTLRKVGGFYKLPLAWESDDITAFMVANPNGVVHTAHPTFFYRINGQTITNTGNVEIKLESTDKAYLWYKNFLTSYSPVNVLEQQLLLQIKQNLDSFFTKKKIHIIASDIAQNVFHSFKWIFHKNSYNLSSVLVLQSIAKGIVDSIKH